MKKTTLKPDIKYTIKPGITIDGIKYTKYIVKKINKNIFIEFINRYNNTCNFYNFVSFTDVHSFVQAVKEARSGSYNDMYDLKQDVISEASNEASLIDTNASINTEAEIAPDDYFTACKKALESSDLNILIPVMSKQLDSFKLERFDCIFDKYVNPTENARIEFKNSVIIACIIQQDTMFAKRYSDLMDREITKVIDDSGNTNYIDKDKKPIKEKDVIFYENYVNFWDDASNKIQEYIWDSYTSASAEANENVQMLIASEIAGTKLPACFEYKKPDKECRNPEKYINKIIDLSIVYWKNIGTNNFKDCKKRLKNAICEFYKTFLKHDADNVYNQFSGGCNDKMLAKIASKVEKTIRDKDTGKYKSTYSCYNNLACEMRNIFLMQLQGEFITNN